MLMFTTIGLSAIPPQKLAFSYYFSLVASARC